MFRLVALLTTVLAVANATTLLYPTSYRQVSWPVQSQYSLSGYSSLPYSPLYTSVYRYPTQYQMPYQRIQYQYIQSAPTRLQTTETRTLPIYWGRSYGDVSSAGQQSQYGQQQQSKAIAPSNVAPAYSVSAGYAGQQAASIVRVPSTPIYAVNSGYAGQQSGAVQSVPAYYSVVVPQQQPQQFVGQQGVHSTPIYAVNQGYAGYGQQGGAIDRVHSAPVYPVNSAVAYPISSSFVSLHQPSHPFFSYVQQLQSVPIPASYASQSQPITYSVEFPRSYAANQPQQQPLASSAQISQISGSQGVPAIGQHQASYGHHQVSPVTIPGQVGVGGGYTSAAFYETAPASVVIPSVPLSSEPIAASEVKIASSKAAGEPAQSIQSHGQGNHQGVQAF